MGIRDTVRNDTDLITGANDGSDAGVGVHADHHNALAKVANVLLDAGANGEVLTKDTAQPQKVKWAAGGGGSGGPYVRVDRSMPNVLDLGVVNDGTLQSPAAMQAALNGNPALEIPTGVYKFSGGLTRPDTCRHIEGHGMSNTILEFPNDAGAGQYAIGGAAPSPQRPRKYTGHLTVRGQIGSLAMGVAPQQQWGMKDRGHELFESVRCEGFKAGLVTTGDHSVYIDYNPRWNYWNWYLSAADGVTYLGDHSFYGCQLAGSLFADVAVAPTQYLLGVLFSKCHFGFSPYSLFKESGAAGQTFFYNCTFDTCQFEAFGNAVLWDDLATPTSLVKGLVFENCATGLHYHLDYRIAGRSRDHMAKLGAVEDMAVRGTSQMFGGGPPDQVASSAGALGGPGLVSAFRFNSLKDLDWEKAKGPIDLCNTAGVPVFGPSLPVLPERSEMHYRGTRARVLRNLTSAVTPKDLVKANTADAFSPIVGGPVAGVALVNSAVNQANVVADRGRVTVKATGAIAARDFIRPSATANMVESDGVTKTAASIGYAIAAAANSEVDAWLF